MKNKIFTRIIITTLLCAFLTFNVGKVTRVSAVGTTIAASAAAALCAVGIVYCSYMALSGASVHVPDTVEDIETWLTDIGTKVVQYPSGREAYNEIYPQLLRSPAGNLIHDLLDSQVWTWTSDKLKYWANDFSSTGIITDIASFTRNLNVDNIPYNAYDYSFTFTTPATYYSSSVGYKDLSTLEWQFLYTGHVIAYNPAINANITSGLGCKLHSDITNPVRNYFDGTYYYPQQYVNGTWEFITSIQYGYGRVSWGEYCKPRNQMDYYNFAPNALQINGTIKYTWPLFPDDVIYDSRTDTTYPLVIPESTEIVRNPQWPTLPPEDDNKPVIPYLKLPYDPSWIDPITGTPGGGNWGFNLAQLLDALEDLAGLLMEIGSIGELINQFKNLIDGQSGDEYYIYYDDSTHNYYQYYTITNFGDNIYNFDIDVSEVDEHLPVDLNTIQTYSSNRYLEQIKQSAINGSSIVRDLAVFWYDVDPEVTYIALGIYIVILIGAFTGKLGHS